VSGRGFSDARAVRMNSITPTYEHVEAVRREWVEKHGKPPIGDDECAQAWRLAQSKALLEWYEAQAAR
jgi:hypothetical protein